MHVKNVAFKRMYMYEVVFLPFCAFLYISISLFSIHCFLNTKGEKRGVKKGGSKALRKHLATTTQRHTTGRSAKWSHWGTAALPLEMTVDEPSRVLWARMDQ
jgi:hypothetical protein